MPQPAPVRRNAILGALPPPELRALEPRLDYVALPAARLLHDAGEPLRYVFFPTSGIVSLLHVDENGASEALTVVGFEGMVGLAALLGGDTAMTRAVVQVPGAAYRLSAAHAKLAFSEAGRFQALILRFAHGQIVQLAQTGVCKLHHSVERQLCRWLLLCLDRVQANEIEMTHERIAGLLGVRRQGVTEAARKLQKRNIIAYARGRIRVLDRAALEQQACDCYARLKKQVAAMYRGA